MKRLENVVHSFLVERIGEDHKGQPFAEIRKDNGSKTRLYEGDIYHVVVEADDEAR